MCAQHTTDDPRSSSRGMADGRRNREKRIVFCGERLAENTPIWTHTQWLQGFTKAFLFHFMANSSTVYWYDHFYSTLVEQIARAGLPPLLPYAPMQKHLLLEQMLALKVSNRVVGPALMRLLVFEDRDDQGTPITNCLIEALAMPTTKGSTAFFKGMMTVGAYLSLDRSLDQRNWRGVQRLFFPRIIQHPEDLVPAHGQKRVRIPVTQNVHGNAVQADIFSLFWAQYEKPSDDVWLVYLYTPPIADGVVEDPLRSYLLEADFFPIHAVQNQRKYILFKPIEKSLPMSVLNATQHELLFVSTLFGITKVEEYNRMLRKQFTATTLLYNALQKALAKQLPT